MWCALKSRGLHEAQSLQLAAFSMPDCSIKMGSQSDLSSRTHIVAQDLNDIFHIQIQPYSLYNYVCIKVIPGEITHGKYISPSSN